VSPFPLSRAETPDVFAPAKLGPVTLRNRTIKAATFEGLSRKGLVTDPLIDFHVRVAAGGVGMTTLSFCAVAPEGCQASGQIVWRPEAVLGLRRLTDAVHAEGAAVAVQIGHAGAVGNPKATGMPALAPSRHFHKTTLSFAKAASRDELHRIVRQFGEGARMAADAGFDAIEVHLGHNYLPSSFLSPRINHRDDEYGGSLENRARLSMEIMRAVRDAVGDRVAILAKLNMDDGVPGGFWLDEAVTVSRWLEESGSLDALELTAGSSLLNPMYLFKGAAPLREFAGVMKEPMKTGIKLVGSRVLREYPYQDGYLLKDAKQIRSQISLPMVLLGGITNRQIMDTAMEEGFEFVALGRALLREPDLINRIQAEPRTRSLCDHNNKCMTTIYRGSRCVYVDRGAPSPFAADEATASASAPAARPVEVAGTPTVVEAGA
jgi:2,4-dienoyl-CoA reductase-like NADH-dependent reductase (Old Yellow Enzyme family)